jgi:hypothetical protein
VGAICGGFARVRHRRTPRCAMASLQSRMYAVSGGLMSCGIDVNEPYRQAAAYVDRILKGAKPGELPVQAGAGRFPGRHRGRQAN